MAENELEKDEVSCLKLLEAYGSSALQMRPHGIHVQGMAVEGVAKESGDSCHDLRVTENAASRSTDRRLVYTRH